MWSEQNLLTTDQEINDLLWSMTTENIFEMSFQGEILALWGVFLIRRNFGCVNMTFGG